MNKLINHYLVSQELARLAVGKGLHFLGMTPLAVAEDFKRFETWIAEGRHAEMVFLERNLEVRKDPGKLLPGVRSAFIFGLPYNAGDRWRRGDKRELPRIAMYARLKDYHKVLKRDLEEIMTAVQKLGSCGGSFEFRVTVDSAPLLERAVAAKAGQGFIGKNTCFIHPKLGSLMLLGEALTTLELTEQDNPITASTHLERTKDGGCGTCRRCQVHCPTGALDQDYRIDARKCLSWWTIENRGTIPREFWPWIGEYLFGCDICQLVCPWNRGQGVAPRTEELTKLKVGIDPYDVATMSHERYVHLFSGTAATRAKREGLIRNALIALHVKNDTRLREAIELLRFEIHPAVVGTIAMIKTEKTANPQTADQSL